MSIMGYLTGLLKPQHVAEGYGLIRDEDFICLYRYDEKVTSFNASVATIEDIEAYIEKQQKVLTDAERLKAFAERIEKDTAHLLTCASLLKWLNEGGER